MMKLISTSLSSPTKTIMRKKKTDHIGAAGISDSAFGYAMNTRPGPPSATSATDTPCCFAMKPSTEKTVKPENSDVDALTQTSAIESLQ